MPGNNRDKDMQWLLSCVPESDLLDVHARRVRPVREMIRALERNELPSTIGLFGGWGCGKTTFLAMLAEDLLRDENGLNVIYFNAWKYAGFMEVVPALVFKIVDTVSGDDDVDARKVFSVLLSLGKKYADQIGEWSERFLGVNAVEIASEIIDIDDTVRKKLREDKTEALSLYYSQIDRAQDTLEKFLGRREQPIVVLIDELDRCDPGEAFDVIKQLRIFFAMREIPLIFLLSANPEPIGLAIKHQYGLARRINDYEAKRILEKFVDTYVDMSDPLPLARYVAALWDGEARGFVDGLLTSLVDARFEGVGRTRNMLRDVDVLHAFSTNNYLYSNLRVLQKSLRYVCSQKSIDTPLLWAAWHLEIISEIHEDFRRDIRLLARELGVIAYEALDSTIHTLSRHGVIDEHGSIPQQPAPVTDKGNTAFAIYRSCFWEGAQQTIRHLDNMPSVESASKKRAIEQMLSDPQIMDFVIILCLPDFERDREGTDMSLEGLLRAVARDNARSGDLMRLPRHFEYLLANY